MRGIAPLLALVLALLASDVWAGDEAPSVPPRAPEVKAAEADLAKLEAEWAAWDAAGEALRAARVLSRIASALEGLQRYEEARTRHDEAVAARRDIADPLGVARALYGKAGFEMRRRRFADAEASYAAGMEALDGAYEPSWEAILLLEISRARREAGNAEGALEAARAAFEIQQTLDDPCGTAKARGRVGSCLFGMGRFGDALEAHLQALDVYREHGDQAGTARALASLGNVHLRIGSHAEALECYEDALDLYRTLKDRANVAVTLGNLVIVHEATGNFERALDCYKEALGLYRELNDRRRLAAILAAAGIVDMRLGQPEAALEKEQRALQLYEALGDSAGQVRALVNTATIQERQGRLADARATCDRAEKTLEADAPASLRAGVLWTRARVLLAEGRTREAVREARRTIDVMSELRAVAGLAGAQEAGSRDVYDGLFFLGVQAAVELGDEGVLAWALEQCRAFVLRDDLAARCMASPSGMDDSLCQEIAAAQAARRDALERYRTAWEGQDLLKARAARAELDAADGAFQRVMRRVERESRGAAARLNTEPYDLLAVRAQVSREEVLVLYGFAKDLVVAQIVRRDSVRTVRLGPPERILEAVGALCAADKKRSVADVEAAAAALRALLAEPLSLPKDVTRVVVSPVGVLGFVPFCLLFPGQDIAFMPSGTTYGQLRSTNAPRGRGILALGDPAYDVSESPDPEPASPGRTRDGRRHDLPRLPATRKEVEKIGTEKLFGTEASESGLAASLGKEERWLAVHFACHGLVDRQRPELSSLALAEDDENDGFLTCSEIRQLRIPADLVVLSACDTGRGRVYETEGIYGLTCAFLYAGADRVLCSLWRADDDATRALMIRFYELWNPQAKPGDPERPKGAEGAGRKALGAAAALRRAQDAVRNDPEHPEWQHPYYWAAWVLWGLPD